MRRRIFDISIAVLVMLAGAPGDPARADQGEASLHAQVLFGNATVGIRDAPGQTDSGLFVGAGARVTYAISNWYAFEAAVSLADLDDRMHYTVDTMGMSESWRYRMTWARADLGMTARFGVRWIPTLHGALGAQRRVVWEGYAEPVIQTEPEEQARALPEHLALELIGTLGAGLDYRLGDHWVTGMAVTGQRALLGEAPFRAIAVTFHISYYFYPEGAGL